ncbi:MAG: cytochrome c [Bacteroidetes bacterium]|nr:cytochrome c [Bacteroidota bacterium]
MKWTKFTYLFLFAFLLGLSSCRPPSRQKVEIPDKARLKPSNSIPYNTDTEEYSYPNSKEGYELAGLELRNPLAVTGQKLEEGKKLYLALCKHCHGETGNADAEMILKEKYPVPPTFSKRLPNITEGKMFHSITYGKNQMPPNGEDFSSEQKWLLVMYIQNLVNLNTQKPK